MGISAARNGNGYVLTAADGGVFNFGASDFYGSTGDVHLVQPVVGVAGTFPGNGYTLSASDGGIFNFGDSTFCGSTGGVKLNAPVVGMAFF